MRIILFLIFIFATNSWAQEESMSVRKSIIELSTMADGSCINFRVLGACPKPNREPPIGMRVQYFQPEVFMETVKIPGDHLILEYDKMSKILNSPEKTAIQMELEADTKIKPLKITSGSSSSVSGSNLQFNEAHLYDFPVDAVLDMVLCSDVPNMTAGIRYLSEMDATSWRKGDMQSQFPQMNTWGPLYPREGFVITPSEAVGSVVAALRAVSNAGNPLPAHIVESPLNFQPNIFIDKVQMVYPVKDRCMPIGQNPQLWEMGKQSRDGRYVWIFWHRRQCCI